MSDMITNRFKQRLQAGELMHGLWSGMASNIAAEICAQAAFDFLLIDAEHSPLSDRDVLSCLQAVAPYKINPIVRPVSGDRNVLKRLCDIGVQSFLVPMVDDAKQAADIVSAVRYPAPKGEVGGTRGLGTSMARAARWNMAPDYFKRANGEMCVIIQIETKAGLANLDKIANVDGVDAVFIGPSDLGAALGYPGEPMREEVVSVVEKALKELHALGKPTGVLAVAPELAERYIASGASFVGVGSDCGILAKGAANLAKSFKSGGDVKGEY